MTLAESEEARRRLLAMKAADRTERRLFDNLTAIRAIEAQAKTTTARRKAERTRQARRSAEEAAPLLPHPDARAFPPAGMAIPEPLTTADAAPQSSSIEPFADVEML